MLTSETAGESSHLGLYTWHIASNVVERTSRKKDAGAGVIGQCNGIRVIMTASDGRPFNGRITRPTDVTGAMVDGVLATPSLFDSAHRILV
ncbi:hypothetical protein QA600_21700 [Natronococcus sp. A-GB1]|uniref:hypothetical protein n=1 Tax=Natronococcus TaxID=29287 RepID=UPI00241D8717|nr:hypothetical protein [Natronococcus sp. A-GB1]MDG5761940.1 hypothetical protein [Natronococcus sp. A-GB1]